jgi:hypothetical protein
MLWVTLSFHFDPDGTGEIGRVLKTSGHLQAKRLNR